MCFKTFALWERHDRETTPMPSWRSSGPQQRRAVGQRSGRWGCSCCSLAEPGSGSQPAHSNKVQVCGCPPSNHGWLGPGMSAMHSAEMWGSLDLLAFCIIERKALLIESWHSHRRGMPKMIFQVAHQNAMAGHMKYAKTLEQIMARFYWLGIWADVRWWCAPCLDHQLVNQLAIAKVPITM